MTIYGQTSGELIVTGSDGVIKLSGGTPAASRSLSLSGSSDVTMYTDGNNYTYNMPPSSSTIVGDVTSQYMTNKSGSFVHIEIPAQNQAPTGSGPVSQSGTTPMIYDTLNDVLYVYNAGVWRSSSFNPSGDTTLPAGTVSSSVQIDYLQIQNVPSGIVSSSGQIDYTGLQNIPVGIVSSSAQVDYTGLQNIPTGIVSSSTQIVTGIADQQISPVGVTGSFTGSFDGSISGYEEFKSFTVADPAADDNIALFYTQDAITITELADVISGTTSVTWNISYASTRDNGTPTDLFTADRVTSTTSGATTTTFNNASIPAGSWVWYAASALSGTPTQLHITIRYRVG